MSFYARYPSVMSAGGGATAANQVIEIGLLTTIDADTSAISANTPTLGQKTMAGSSPVVIASDQSAVAVSGPLTDAQLRATPVPVSGTVATGGLTDAQLRASPVPVSGTVSVTGVSTAANQATEIASLASIDSKLTSPLTVTGTVSVTGVATAANQATEIASLSSIDSKLTSPLAVTGPLTDAQLRATPVPVSGTVSTGGLTDAQLRASPVPVSGTVTANAGSGTFAISAAALPLPSGAATSANQATEISSLTSIDTNTGNTVSYLASIDAGIPAALGQTTMSASMPVVIASNQTAIPISGSITATPSVNTAGSYDEITNLTTSAQTFTAPANAVGFLLEALSANTVNLRWKAGATATTTSGMRLEPGRDTGYLPMKANISIITESGSSQVATIQWILSS